MIKPDLIASAALVTVLSVSACSTEGTVNNTAHLDVTVSHAGMECSLTSPEIQVYGTPSQANKYVVELKDLTQPDSKRGGGESPVNPAGLIPAGALKDDFKGPCPADGGHTYRYDVKAVTEGGKVLGVGSYSVTM